MERTDRDAVGAAVPAEADSPRWRQWSWRGAGAGGRRITTPTSPSTAPRPPRQRSRPVVYLRGVTKTYGNGETTVHAVAGVNLLVERGDYVAVMGASGSGKSTLMNIIGCLDVPTRGRYLLDGVDIRRMDGYEQAVIRNRKIGFVFQSFNLIPRTSALANVEMPLAYAGVKTAERRRRAMAALARVGLSDRVGHLSSQLSGGQQQRVAIARAIVNDPVLLLADEPTGALDSHATADVLALFDELNAGGRTVIVITHEEEVAAHSKRVLRMIDGRIVSDIRQGPLKGLPPRYVAPAEPGSPSDEPALVSALAAGTVMLRTRPACQTPTTRGCMIGVVWWHRSAWPSLGRGSARPIRRTSVAPLPSRSAGPCLHLKTKDAP